MDDIDGLVEVLTIIPSLMDRRELWVFLAKREGGYRPLEPMELERSVLSLETGPPGLPVIALTDVGISVLRLEGGTRAVLEPILAERPVLARSGTFIPDLGLVRDLDGDGRLDLLFPTAGGATVYLGRAGRLSSAPAAHLEWLSPDDPPSTLEIFHPLPEIRDVNGDRLPDLVLPDRREWERFQVLLGTGGGHFADPVAPLHTGEDRGSDEHRGEHQRPTEDDARPATPDVVHFGDLDGDGIAEYVTQEDLIDEDAGVRKEIHEAKNPPFRYRLYRMRPDLGMAAAPYSEFEAVGYAFDGSDRDDDIRLPGGFQDLDGDGRADLVTLTLDFSVMMQAARILATHRASIGLDFHVWCQGDDGRFKPVAGLDLSGKFKLDLNNLKIGQLSQFAGDFDGDGKADFVQMGRGRNVTIHRGRAGCSYPVAPDLTVRLKEEPHDLKLVQVRDLDADGLADLLVIQPQKVTEPGVTPPVRLDLYLSGGAP